MLEKISMEKERMKIDKNDKNTDILKVKESKGNSKVLCNSSIIDVHERRYGIEKESLKKKGKNDKSDKMEKRTINSLKSNSYSTTHMKEIDHKAKKKESKKLKKREFEKRFNVMDNVKKRNKEKNTSFMNRSPSDNSIGNGNPVQDSSLQEMDSVITKTPSHEGSTTSVFSSGTGYSAAASQALENLSTSSMGSVNDRSKAVSKDIFQFQPNDDRCIRSGKAKFKVNSNKLKLPITVDISPRVQLTDIACSMLSGGIKAYKPYNSPIASLKNKINLAHYEAETAKRNIATDYITSHEQDNKDKDVVLDIVKDSIKDGTMQFEKPTILREGEAKSCFDKAESKECSFENEHDNSSDLLFDAGSTKESRNRPENSVMKSQSVGKSTIKGVNYPNFPDKPGVANLVTNASFTGSKSIITSNVSQFERQANHSYNVVKPIRSEAGIGMQNKDANSTPKRTGTAKEMSVVKVVLTEEETTSREELKKQIPVSDDMLLIRTQEPLENDTTVLKEESSKRKRSEGATDSLPLNIEPRNGKRALLMSHTGGSELSSRANENKESTPSSSLSIMENDVWKEASSKLKALINETVKRSGNWSGRKSCSESASSLKVVPSQGNSESLRQSVKRSEHGQDSRAPSLDYRKLFESAKVFFHILV